MALEISQIVKELQDRLKAYFNLDNNDFKILFAGKNTEYNTPVTTPDTLDLGAFANILEYDKMLCQFLPKQIDLTTAEAEYLDNLARYAYNMYRMAGETDAQFKARIQFEIFGTKETKWSILAAITPYNGDDGGGIYPMLLEGDTLPNLGCFADHTFTDQFKKYTSHGGIFPAKPNAKGNNYNTSGQVRFFFRIYMLSVNPTDYQKVFDLVKKIHVAGVKFQISFLTESIFG